MPRTEGAAEAGEWRWTGAGTTTTGGGETEWGARGWTYDANGDAGTAWTPGPEGRTRAAGDFARSPGLEGRPSGDATTRPGRASGPGPAEADPASLPDLEALARRALPEALLALSARPDRRWRLLVVLLAWPPLGYALGGLVSAATGCAQYSASCPESVPILLLLAQPVLVAVLYALRELAAVAAFASLAALAAAVPVGVVLAVGAMPRPAVEPTVLATIVATVYVIALGAGAMRLWRRPGHP
jgi:hypothetical protein